MIFLSKLFTYLILPPGIFIFALLIASIVSKYFKKTLFLLAVLFYFISTKYGSNMLLKPLEDFKHSDNIKPKAVVVLGGGCSDYGNYFKAVPEAFKREVYGFILAKDKNLPLVFSGGGLGEFNEVICAKSDFKRLEDEFNVTVTKYYEADSVNTRQNAAFTSMLFEEKNLPKKIYLVTSAYHMPRAFKYFKMHDFKIITKSVDFKQDKGDRYLSVLPKMKYLRASYDAIHEYFGLLQIYLSNVN